MLSNFRICGHEERLASGFFSVFISSGVKRCTNIRCSNNSDGTAGRPDRTASSSKQTQDRGELCWSTPPHHRLSRSAYNTNTQVETPPTNVSQVYLFIQWVGQKNKLLPALHSKIQLLIGPQFIFLSKADLKVLLHCW